MIAWQRPDEISRPGDSVRLPLAPLQVLHMISIVLRVRHYNNVCLPTVLSPCLGTSTLYAGRGITRPGNL